MKLNYSYLNNNNNNYQLTDLPSVYAKIDNNHQTGEIVNNEGAPVICQSFIAGIDTNIKGGNAKMSCTGDSTYKCVDGLGKLINCCSNSDVTMITKTDGELQCEAAPEAFRYNCVNGECIKTNDGPYADKNCEGKCPCTIGGKYDLNHLCGYPDTKAICVPYQGCIPDCKNIPNDKLGSCTVDINTGDVQTNNCGVNDTKNSGIDYSKCRKYLSIQPHYQPMGDMWKNKGSCKNIIYTDPGYVGDNNQPSIVNSYKETADVTLRSIPWGQKGDQAHTTCGKGSSTDSSGQHYNIYSCIRDCRPGKKCNFITDKDGIPPTKSGAELNGVTGTCYFDCPDESYSHAPQSCTDNDTHRWYCRNNFIHKKIDAA